MMLIAADSIDKEYFSNERASVIRSSESSNLPPLVNGDDVCVIDRTLCEFDPVINKTFSFILAMAWRGFALAFLVVSKPKKYFLKKEYFFQKNFAAPKKAHFERTRYLNHSGDF